MGYMDVGDRCWRSNVLVTSLRCWLPIQDVTDLIHRENQEHNEKSQQQNDFTNITVTEMC